MVRSTLYFTVNTSRHLDMLYSLQCDIAALQRISCCSTCKLYD